MYVVVGVMAIGAFASALAGGLSEGRGQAATGQEGQAMVGRGCDPAAKTGRERCTRYETPEIQVTASQLLASYNENEVAADNIYRGRIIEVSGTIESIDKDAFDNVIVSLAGGASQSVYARLQKTERLIAANLSPGDGQTMVCRGEGRTVGTPVLTECALRTTTRSLRPR